MGDLLAEAVRTLYQEQIAAGPAFQRLLDGSGRPMTVDEFVLVSTEALAALRSIVLFLAQQMDDPDLVGEALSESLRGFIATEPAG